MNLEAMTTYSEDKVRALVDLTHAALAKLLLEALPEIERRRQQKQSNKQFLSGNKAENYLS